MAARSAQQFADMGQSSTASAIALAAAAGALRLALFYCTDLHELLASTVWLSSPITSWKRFCDGLWLLRHGLNVYSGDVFHQPLPAYLVPFLFVLADIAIGMLLCRIAVNKGRVDPLGCTPAFQGEWQVFPSASCTTVDLAASYTKTPITQTKSETTSTGYKKSSLEESDRCGTLWVAALYYLNPLSIAACLAFDVGIFERLAIVATVYAATLGNLLEASLCIAMAMYLGLYPVMLVPSIGLIFSKQYHAPPSKTVMGVCLSTFVWTLTLQIASVFLLDYKFDEVWRFWVSFYGTILTVPDLTPNIGLWWYFMTEVFDHFREFFLFVFQAHLFIYAIPLALRFRERPLFVVVLSLGIMAAFKSYTTIGDYALWFGFLPLYSETWKYFRYSFLSVNTFVYSLFLCPTMYYLWVYQGSANANFFYALSLVVAIGSTLIMTDSVYGLLRREFDRQKGVSDVKRRETVLRDVVFSY